MDAHPSWLFDDACVFLSSFLFQSVSFVLQCSGDFKSKLGVAILTGIVSVCQWQFILSIIIEMKTILGIHIFATKQTQQL